MKIAKVALKNFMRYDDAEIELHEGFNAVVGQTDAGKSTIIRALTWVFYNKPSGTEMCRVGTDETSVTVWTDTGIEVERYRSKKRNAYRLGDTWFDNVATGVPEPIQQALGIHLAELSTKDREMLNVSRQMDGPFLISAPGSDTAKILGNLSGITKIDQGLASLRPDIAAAKKQIDVAEKLQRNYDASIGEFDGLDEQVAALEALGKQLSAAGALNQRLIGLRDLSERMDSYNAVVTTVDREIAEQQAITQHAPALKAAQELFERISLLEEIDHKMIAANGANAQIESNLIVAAQEITALEQRYKDILHEAGRCPTCGQAT